MPMLQWNDGLSVKVTEIDDQHKTLVEMVNSLHDSMTDNSDNEVLFSIVDRMTQYTVEHFSTEERYMEEYNDPDIEKHKAEHSEFVEKAMQLQKDLQSGEVVISMDVLNFLSSWLVTHIIDTDKQMGAFLAEQGVS